MTKEKTAFMGLTRSMRKRILCELHDRRSAGDLSEKDLERLRQLEDEHEEAKKYD